MFKYNPESAKNADAPKSINETGKYVCWIMDAEYITSQGGAKGMRFDVMTKDKETCSFDIYYTNRQGEPIFGQDSINSILACTGVQQDLTEQQKMLKRYDSNVGNVIDKACTVAPELSKKKIGLLLQRENYTKQNGSMGYTMKFYGAFQADTELTAYELLNGSTEPKALAKRLQQLINTGDAVRTQTNTSQSGGYAQHKTDNGYTLNPGFANPTNNLEDDLPF